MKTSSASCRLLFLLVIFLGVFLVQFSEGANYRMFQRQHIDYPKTRAPNPNAYCNLMMARRRMTRPRCKPTNTFINNRSNDIRNICRTGTNTNGNIFESRQNFQIVMCRNRGTATNCRYVGQLANKRIKVACRNNLPVHFQP